MGRCHPRSSPSGHPRFDARLRLPLCRRLFFAPGSFGVWSLTAVTALAQAPGGPSPDAPSDEPAASESPKSGVAAGADKPARLKGFDLALTIFNSSGVYFGAEGYTNSFTLWLEPSYAIGERFFKGRWLEKLKLGGRFPVEAEVVGNDARFRGTGFGSSALLNAPEAL